MVSNRYQLANRFMTDKDVYSARLRAERQSGPIQMNDPVLDAEWAAQQGDDSGPRPYFDYYYAGEDMRVYVAETADDPEYGDLPMINLGYNITQSKQPIYGFWNYTYNGVMRGTRIIQGQFSLVTKHPDYMKRLLTVAAKNRTQNSGNLKDKYQTPSSWTHDEENLERYWGKGLDASARIQAGSVFSQHPPFSLVIVYGIQGTSVETNGLQHSFDPYDDQNLLMYDHNQRLTEGMDPNQPSRVILDGVELMASQTTFQNNTISIEQYTFFARDRFVPRDSDRTQQQPHTHGGGRQEF